jgi:hypothetical protein
MADLCVAWGAAQPIHLSVSYNLNSTLQWTSSAMETVLNDWEPQALQAWLGADGALHGALAAYGGAGGLANHDRS